MTRKENEHVLDPGLRQSEGLLYVESPDGRGGLSLSRRFTLGGSWTSCEGRQGGFLLRGGDRRPQAVLDGRGLGVVRELAALRVAVGVGTAARPAALRRPGRARRTRRWSEPITWGCAISRAQTLSRRDNGRRGLLTRKGSTLCRDGWSVAVMSSSPPAVALRKPQASQPARKCSVAGLVVASM